MRQPKRGTPAWYGARIYDWRPAPFGRVRKVPPHDAARWKNGISGRAWPAGDVDRLMDLIDRGYGYDAIARKLGRTRVAVEMRCKRLGARVLTTPATLSASDVAALLGKRCSKSVSRWARCGWLEAHNAGSAQKPLWRITWEALEQFIANPAYWPTWEPSRITDADLREQAMVLRGDEARYLTLGEVARRYHVEPATVGQWLDKGWLPARQVGRQNRLIAERDLVGWVPPCQRTRHREQWGIGQCDTPGCTRRWCYKGRCQLCRRALRRAA